MQLKLCWKYILVEYKPDIKNSHFTEIIQYYVNFFKEYLPFLVDWLRWPLEVNKYTRNFLAIEAQVSPQRRPDFWVYLWNRISATVVQIE